MSKIRLKDITSFDKGKQINGDKLISDGKYDYLNGGTKPSGKWNEYNTNGNTIAVSEGGNSCGYVNFMNNPFWCGAHCYYLYDIKCNIKYLYYALKSQQDRIMKLRSGACMPNIKKSDLGNFVFEYNQNPDDQAKTVYNLDRLTLVINLCEVITKKLDTLVKSRFVEMFEDLKDRRTIADLCSIITDGTHQPPKFSQSGIPFLFVSNIVKNEITYNAEKFISEETYNELYKRTPIEIGDIILSTVGSYGHPAVVKTDRKFLFQRHIAYLKPISSVINSIYMHSAILSNDAQRQIEERVKGIAQKTLNLSEIRKITIPIAPISLQQQFADFVAQTDKSKYCLVGEQILGKAEMLIELLNQEYFG